MNFSAKFVEMRDLQRKTDQNLYFLKVLPLNSIKEHSRHRIFPEFAFIANLKVPEFKFSKKPAPTFYQKCHLHNKSLFLLRNSSLKKSAKIPYQQQ